MSTYPSDTYTVVCLECGGPIVRDDWDSLGECARCGVEVDERPGRRVQAISAHSIRRAEVSWLFPGRIPLGMVTILAGVGGLGKSTWTCLLAGENDGFTLIATAEDSPETTVRPRLEAVRADLKRVQFLSVRTEEGYEDGIVIPDDLEELEELVARKKANLVIVDPLVAHLPGHIDSYKDQSVRRALAPLYRLAKSQDCAVVALVHLNKAQGLAPLARLSGSGAFGNAARSVLLLDRDPDDEEQGTRRVLAHIKCNVGPEMPSLLYEIEPIHLEASGNDPAVETSRLRFICESPHDGRSLLALPTGEARSALEDAMAFLQAELGDGGRRPAGELMKAARALGHSTGTVHTARKRLGVETEKAGFGGGWEWWLPKVQGLVEPSRPDSSQKGFADAGLRPVGILEDSASQTLNVRAADNASQCPVCHLVKSFRLAAGVRYFSCGHLVVDEAAL